MLLGSAYGKVEVDASGVKRGVDSAKTSLTSLATMGTHIGAGLENLGHGMMQLGATMTAAFTVPLAIAGKKAFDVFREFEQSLNILKAVSGATEEEMERLGEEARELGADLTLPGTSAADAAEAMVELAKAGLDVNEILSATRGVLQLAVAGQMSNAEAARVAATAMNAFHLEGSEAVRVADMLAAAALASTAEVKEMADSLQMSAAVASMTGIEIDDLITSIALMANAGIAGSDAGTSVKQMLLSLQTPTDKQKKLMRELGIEVYDASGNMKSMSQLIAEFGTAMSGLTQEERNFALGVIFGSDAIRAANILLLGGTKAFDEMNESVNKTGVAAGLAASMMEGLTGSMENIKSSFETAAIAAIEPFKEDLKTLLGFVAKALNLFSQLPEPMRKMIVVFLALLALAGPALIFFGFIVSAIGSVVGLISTLGALGVTIPVVVAGITALVTALAPLIIVLAALGIMAILFAIAWKTNFLGVRDATVALVKIVKSLWSALMAFLRGDTDEALEHLREAFQTFKDHVANYFSGFSRFVENWKNFLTMIRNALTQTVTYISKTFTNIDWGQIGKYIVLGIANGMLLGIPSLLLVAKKVAESVLLQIKKSLGISSPSKAAMKLGIFTGQGFAQGVRMGMDPDVIARAIARPITNSNSTQQNFTMQFASGLTLKEVRNEIAANNEQIMNFFTTSLQQG